MQENCDVINLVDDVTAGFPYSDFKASFVHVNVADLEQEALERFLQQAFKKIVFCL
jgi:hypothetical protein